MIGFFPEVRAERAFFTADYAEAIEMAEDRSIDLILTSPPYFGAQKDYGVNAAEPGRGSGGDPGLLKDERDYIDAMVRFVIRAADKIKRSGNIIVIMGDYFGGGYQHFIPERIAYKVAESSGGKVFPVSGLIWVKTSVNPLRDIRAMRPHYRRETVTVYAVSRSERYFDKEKYLERIPSSEFIGGRTDPKSGKKGAVNPPGRNKQLTLSDFVLVRKYSGTYRYYLGLLEKSELTPEEKKKAVGALKLAERRKSEGKITGYRLIIRGLHAAPFRKGGGRARELEKKGFILVETGRTFIVGDVITCPTAPAYGGHPAPFPLGLAAMLIDSYCPPGGKVFDPFLGSGTSAEAAVRKGRKAAGSDIVEEYVKFAVKRVKAAAGEIGERDGCGSSP